MKPRQPAVPQGAKSGGSVSKDEGAWNSDAPPSAERFFIPPTEERNEILWQRRLFTSESVTEGHPDKICDQISDAVLDAILAQDPDARVACETTASTGLIHVMGEITTSCYVDIPKIARQVVKEIGYDRAKFGFDCDTCAVVTSINEQSPDIAMGVDKCLEAKEGTQDDEPGQRGWGPGHDVRLRLRRDPRADAAAHLSGPAAGPPSDPGPQGGTGGLPAP